MYSYKGDDRLDITVKGNDPIGKIFAPTWKMVNDYRSNYRKVDIRSKYIRDYHNLMLKSYKEHRGIWENILSRDRVTFVCYCKPGFCHRFILKDYFVKLGAIYGGEKNIEKIKTKYL